MENTEGTSRLEGRVIHVIFENEDTGYTVFEVESGGEYYEVAGVVGQVHIGESVVAHGSFESHPTYGEQFRAVVCETSVPQAVQDILAYLSAGALPYIGPATAKKLVARFGEKTLDVIAQEPRRLTDIKGISGEKALRISEEFKKMFGAREVVAWLARFGVSAPRAMAVYNAFGPHTLEALTQNPYLLCGEPLQMRFALADSIAAELQMSGENKLRVWAALLYVLRHNAGNGHTCLPRRRLTATTGQFIGVEAQAVEEHLDGALEAGELKSRQMAGGEYIYLPELLSAEEDIAARLADLACRQPTVPPDLERNIRVLERSRGMEYAPLQRQAIRTALTSNVLMLTGGPGTGKTTTVNAILALFENQADRVALCAPTGRAAKRLSELTGHKASTIHRLLEVDYSGGVLHFIHNEKNLLRCDVIILDEMSMVDVKLFQSLLAALKRGCRIIMVGDADQLPSVGPGNILGEVICSGVVPTVCLTQIFRQAASSLIVANAHRIVTGQIPETGGREDDFFFLKAGGMACQQLICDLVAARLPRSYGFDPVRDIQVLCPTKMGPSGTRQLNLRLQEMLNPPSIGKDELKAGEQIFRVGDKVMQVRNDYDIPFEREGGESGVGAFNGDIGIVLEVNTSHRSLKVRMHDRILVYTAEHLNELETAYAVTIHKSQGSEFPAVVLPVSEVPEKLCYRNLLYTGVTRAKKLCILAGSGATVQKMVENVRQNLRYSGLGELLMRAMPGGESGHES